VAKKSSLLKKATKRVFVWLGIVVIPIFILASAIYVAEGGLPGSSIKNFLDAVWWTVVTMSTVGYGDVVPITSIGRVIAILAMFSGIIMIAGLTATLASTLIERVVKRMNQNKVERFRDHVLILGWNENGLRIIGDLYRECQEKQIGIVVMADIEPPSSIQQDTYFIKGDPTRLENLDRASAEHAKAAVVLADFEINARNTDSKVILTALAVKRVSKNRCRVICEVLLEEDAEYLRHAGVDEIIVRSGVAGDLLSRSVSNPGVAELMQILLKTESPGSLGRISIPAPFHGKRYEELVMALYSQSEMIVVALIRSGNMMVNPSQNEIIQPGDEAFIVSASGGECRI